MHIRRFFIDAEINLHNTIVVKGDERNHIVKVLRLKQGDEINIFNGQGKEYKATIKSIHPKEVYCEIDKELEVNTEAKLKVFLAFSVPKGEKIDLIIQKCTELGIYMLVPFRSEYTVVDYKGTDIKKKLRRWENIAINACKQSFRIIVPAIEYKNDFQSCIDFLKDKDLRIILNESEKKMSLKNVLMNSKQPKNVAVVIGPEGGFTEKEVEYSIKCGFESVSLGKRILRAETAAISALSIIMNHFDEL